MTCFLWVSLSYLLVCQTGFVAFCIFSCNCLACIYFPTVYSFSNFFMCYTASFVYSAYMLEASVLCFVFEQRKGKRRLWSGVTLSPESCKACLFLDLPHNNVQLTPHTHTLCHTHCVQSSLRKQATAITRTQTGAALCRKTCSHFLHSWLTHYCPIICYSTWKTPKTTLDIFGFIA